MLQGSEICSGIAGGVARITLNRPHVRNALRIEDWKTLSHTIRDLDSRSDVKVIIVRGSPPSFCAGLDLSVIAEVKENPDKGSELVWAIEEVMGSIESARCPVIGAVNGAAMGGGMELATACDVRIMSRSARCGIPAGKLGVVITGQDTQRLVALIGRSRAFMLLGTGRIVTSGEALSMGWADEVVEPEEFESGLHALCENLMDQSSDTITFAKKWCRRKPEGMSEGLVDATNSWRRVAGR